MFSKYGVLNLSCRFGDWTPSLFGLTYATTRIPRHRSYQVVFCFPSLFFFLCVIYEAEDWVRERLWDIFFLWLYSGGEMEV
jgi:hypothetical protein